MWRLMLGRESHQILQQRVFTIKVRAERHFIASALIFCSCSHFLAGHYSLPGLASFTKPATIVAAGL